MRKSICLEIVKKNRKKKRTNKMKRMKINRRDE